MENNMTDLTDLIPILLQKTMEGKIEWDDISSGSYIARLGENSAEVAHDREGGAKLSLLDTNGRTLETVTWSKLSSPFDEQLNELMGIARRKALRIDETVRDVKGFLDRL
jgi:hypothetical protein